MERKLTFNLDDLLAKVTALEAVASRVVREKEDPEKYALISLPNKRGNRVNVNPYSVPRGTVISISDYEYMLVRDHWIDCNGILYTTEELCRKIHDSYDGATLIHFG